MRIFLLILTLLAYPLIAHGMIINGLPNIAIILLVSLGLISITISLIRGSLKKTDLTRFFIYLVIILWGSFNLFSDSSHVLYLPSILINLIISFGIALSLRSENTPLMESVIRMSAVNELPALVVREARVLTMIWSIFFLLMATASFVLALWSSLEIWSLFANVLYFVFLGAAIFIIHTYQHLRYRRMGVPISWKSAYKLLRLYATSKNTDGQILK